MESQSLENAGKTAVSNWSWRDVCESVLIFGSTWLDYFFTAGSEFCWKFGENAQNLRRL